MLNYKEGSTTKIKVNNKLLIIVNIFKYLGYIIYDSGSKPEILESISQTIYELSISSKMSPIAIPKFINIIV